MMISPDTFIEPYRKADYKELIKARDKLITDIRKFEKKEMADDRSGEEWRYAPSPEVKYQVHLEYLSALCALMQERYNEEYVWGDKKLNDI